MNKLKVGIFADKGMGKWLVQSFEPLSGEIDLTLFIPENNKHKPENFQLPKHVLSHNQETLLSLRHPAEYLRRWKIENEGLTRVDFYYFSLIEHFRKHAYDILLTKADRSLYTLASLKDRFGYKIVYRYPYTLPFSHVFEKRSEFTRTKSYGKIDHFVCISETARRNLEFEGIEPSRIDVVQNSVDLDFFSPGSKEPALMKKLGIREGDRIIIFVGKLTSWKNPFTLLYAAKILADEGIPVRLLLAGRGAQKENLRKTAALLGLTERTIFLDFIENTQLNAYYRLADAAVMPSLTTIAWEDQFPFAVVESLASGLPVVVTNSGGMPELVGDAGMIFPQGNYRELAAHLLRLLSDERMRTERGAASRQRAEQLFNNRKNSQHYLSIFRKIAGR